MKKMLILFLLAVVLTGPVMAADGQKAKRSVFNKASDFFDTFDRPMTRQGNKQNFCNATAEWIRNINK